MRGALSGTPGVAVTTAGAEFDDSWWDTSVVFHDSEESRDSRVRPVTVSLSVEAAPGVDSWPSVVLDSDVPGASVVEGASLDPFVGSGAVGLSRAAKYNALTRIWKLFPDRSSRACGWYSPG